MAEKQIQPVQSNVTKALVSIQAKLKPLRANDKGQHGGFANLEAVMKALQPHLDEQGLALIQRPVGGASGTCTLETILHHCETGEELTSSITIPMQRQNDPQAYGAAMTYGRRYSLMCLFGMVTEDDDAAGASYTLDRLLREMSNCTSVDELNATRDKHFQMGALGDKFWQKVYTLLYDVKGRSLLAMGSQERSTQ